MVLDEKTVKMAEKSCKFKKQTTQLYSRLQKKEAIL